MPAWKQLENGWRTWAKFNGAHWSYDPKSGDIVAVAPDGTAIDTLGASRLGYARDLVKRYARDLHVVDDGDTFYTRGLLGLATVECPPGNLPCPGDCWCKDSAKKLCSCSSDKAGPPNALGLYQVSRVAAKDVGVKFEDLGKSADANHAAAFAVAKKMEPTTGKDFVALAAAWNAGGVYPGALPWGARAYKPSTITEYVRGWNAVGQALRESGSSSSSSSSSTGGGLIPIALLTLAIAASHGWKIGRIFR